jgi:NADH:ubiquinone oxidoreductase subunit K
MLLLILGDNLLLLYFGWEGVGLCSYLLIGFYYSNRNNGNAALKAFIVTRIGDVFMAIGLFILFHQLGTLNIQEMLLIAPQKFAAGDFWIELATLMLLGGAVGKSAQLPLQTWLADPMEHGLAVAGVLFCLGLVGLMVRRNILFVLMSLEIMMNATALAFIVAGSRWGQPDGQIMFILVITLAAAEASIGLAILLQLYRRFNTLDIDAASEMRG